ncbi:MAG: hypothetical protein KJO84_03905 [Acidimicrobiia bacterium]|nr:hypothetical protein [Acidimicrobiia bacterium]
MNKRLQRHDGTGRPDPLDPDTNSQDPVAGWAEELRSAVVADLEPGDVTNVASLASAATAVGAGSLATAAGVAAGAATGGKTVTTLFGSMVAKLVATGALVAALGGGAAITGNLPAGIQNVAADVVANVGIDLPRAAVEVDVDGAGELIIDVVDGAVSIIELDATAGWTAKVRSQTDSEVIVDFVSDGVTKTVTAVQDQSGSISTDVATSTGISGNSDSGLDGQADTTVDSELETPVVDGSVGVGVDVDTTIGVGLTD